jgi:hypothetical protein
MRERLSAYEVQECYRRAEARLMADAAPTAAEKSDFLEVERGWLSLARRYCPQGELYDGRKNRVA